MALCALACLWLAGPAAASERCAVPDDYLSDIRPDPDGPPTQMTIGILVADVLAIDDVTQTIDLDLIAGKKWKDPRLAHLKGCKLQRNEVWFPVSDVLNSNELKRARSRFNSDQVSIEKDGTLTYGQRFYGPVATYHNLRKFPFDEHVIRIRIATFEHPADKVQLSVERNISGLAERLNIPDWTIKDVTFNVEDVYVPELNTNYSMLHVDIYASRHSTFYVVKLLFPLTLIVLMSFVVFWINPERFGPQIGLTATAMLTLIAFQFALSTLLPKVSYMTTMDILILGSTALVFCALVEATITSALVVNGKAQLAQRIDRVCRWLFPALLVLVWAGIYLANWK
nr:hypothetical protein [Pseudovibrio flavus]